MLPREESMAPVIKLGLAQKKEHATLQQMLPRVVKPFLLQM